MCENATSYRQDTKTRLDRKKNREKKNNTTKERKESNVAELIQRQKKKHKLRNE